MSGGRILLGVVLLAAILAPQATAAWHLQRRMAPRTLPLRVLAAGAIALTLVLVTCELAGAVGLFQPLPLVVANLVVAALVALGASRLGPPPSPPSGRPAGELVPRALTLGVGVLAALVAVRWLALTLSTLQLGVHDPDSRHYHLSFAAEFVRTGSLTGAEPIWPDPIHNFHPAGNEVLHALGMLAMDRDVLVPLLAVAWLAAFLLAGWSAGVRDGVRSLTLLAAVWFAAIPLLLATNAGSAVNDLPVLVCLTAAVALWRNADGDRGWLAAAGLALGLAFGIKLTALACVGALTIAIVLLAPPRRRAAVGGILAGTILLAGSFWFLRNLIRTGSPLPSLHLPLLPSPDLPQVDRFGHSVAEYLFDRVVWRDTFGPGIREFFGPGIWLAALGSALGLAGLARSRDRELLALVGCGLVGVIAYVLNPVGAWGPQGNPQPVLFSVNLRYLLPGLVLLALAAALASAGASRRMRLAFAGSLGLATVVALLQDGLSGGVDSRYTLRALLVLALLGGAAWAAARVRAPDALKWAAAAVAVVLVTLVAGPSASRTFLATATRWRPAPAAGGVPLGRPSGRRADRLLRVRRPLPALRRGVGQRSGVHRRPRAPRRLPRAGELPRVRGRPAAHPAGVRGARPVADLRARSRPRRVDPDAARDAARARRPALLGLPPRRNAGPSPLPRAGGGLESTLMPFSDDDPLSSHAEPSQAQAQAHACRRRRPACS